MIKSPKLFLLMLTLFAWSAAGQNDDSKPVLLVKWIAPQSADHSLLEQIRSKTDKLVEFAARATSPDTPTSSRRLWVVSADGAKNTALALVPGVRRPRWGSGKFIAFEIESDTNGDGNIDFHDEPSVGFVAESGGGVTRIGPGMSPIWSPDGKHLAYVSQGKIVVYDVVAKREINVDDPSIPGGVIVYTNKRSLASINDFWTMDMTNRRVEKLPNAKRKYLWLESTSRTGDDAVYSNLARTSIIVKQLTTGKTRTIVADKHVNFDPSWSPDGALIVYVSTRAPAN